LFIAFPVDEDQCDVCLAAGRGSLHINPSGKVEPYPFAPFSDTDLRFESLSDALQSEFLRQIIERIINCSKKAKGAALSGLTGTG